LTWKSLKKKKNFLVQDPAQRFSKEFAVRVSNWTSLEADWVTRLRPFLTERGVSSFGSIGTCWGTYVTVKTATLPEFKAGVRQAWPSSQIFKFLQILLLPIVVFVSNTYSDPRLSWLGLPSVQLFSFFREKFSRSAFLLFLGAFLLCDRILDPCPHIISQNLYLMLFLHMDPVRIRIWIQQLKRTRIHADLVLQASFMVKTFTIVCPPFGLKTCRASL
jgi:hypothetical protein